MTGREPRADMADRILWRRSLMIEATEDEGARHLDLAAFADGRLDPEERERVADRLRRDSEAAADVAAARALASARYEIPSETLVARLRATVADAAADRSGSILTFPSRKDRRSVLGAVVQWSGLAAAMVVAGWLGFTLGMDTSGTLPPSRAGTDDAVTQDLFGSSPAFFRDLTGGA